MRPTSDRSSSIAFRLPLLVSALLLIVVAVLGVTAYFQLQGSLRASAGTRLTDVASLIADLISQSANQALARVIGVAGEPANVAFLRRPDSAGAERVAMAYARHGPTPEGAAFELLDPAGKCLLRVGRLTPDQATPTLDCESPIDSVTPRPNDSIPSLLRVSGDAVYFHIAVPVRDPGSAALLGHAAELRRLRVTPPTLVRRLIGEDSRLLVGNRTGHLWSDLTQVLPGPPVDTTTSAPVVYPDNSGSRRLGSAVAVNGAPWLVWAELPEATVLDPARRLMRQNAAIGVLIILLGVILVMMSARQLTRPLLKVIETADALAAGNYSTRVSVTRRDEFGRLEASFNTMADQVAEAHHLLEQRLEERTKELHRRTELEANLRSSEERLRLLMENLSEVIAVVDSAGTVAFVGPSVERVWGYAHAGLRGTSLTELVHQSDRARLTELLAKPDAADPKGLPPAIRFRHRDGGWRLHEVAARDLRSVESIGGILLTARDVTERSNLEQQLHQAQKMEAVGSLAGGIAHDFNNLLTVILGYTELLIRTGPQDKNTPAIVEIEEAARRAAALTKQLLAFSRRQVLEPKLLELNAVVHGIERMLERVIGEDVQLITVLAPQLSRVRADPGQLEQVIVNLVVNARDAMPKGGQLTIETLDVELDEIYAKEHFGVAPGRYVQLSVSDTGIGMDQATQARVFEPFFTTKPAGKGTGLGLATVYGIVKQSGGHVWLYSEVNRGTTFKIYLPAVDAPAVAASHRVEVSPPRGTETILVVEDESGLRKLIVAVLKGFGFTVLAAKNPEEALRISTESKVHLLLTDVVLPQMSGSELAAKITGEKPDVKVLFMSGYTDDAIIRHGVLEASAAFVQKPFTPVGLGTKVRQVLDLV